MVRTYRRKTDRGKYGEENLSAALEAVSKGVPLIRASKEFGVPARTLRRHRDQTVAEPGVLNFGRYRNALPQEIELQLKAHVLDMQRRLHGLKMWDMRRLAFDIAEKAQINHPFNKESRKAGTDWVQNFLARHKLSIRQPQGTSIARAVGFNKPQVQQFFALYKELLETHSCTPSRLWNMDETGLTTVQQPGKIIAPKGARQVGKITSAERGVLVTLVCACNAAGYFLPPMYIFPRKRMVDTLMKDAPPQAVGYANPSGWSDDGLFMMWLQHFAGLVNCSRENRHIILLDGHHSHKTLQAIEFCRDNGIELITLPPHSTHRMQPLDRTYFRTLKSAFNAEADSWMVTNPGRRITVHDMAGLTGKAFLRTALPERAVQGFKTCGLWPFDPNVFTDVDFEAALVTEEQMEVNAPEQPPTDTNTPVQPTETTAVHPETRSPDCEANRRPAEDQCSSDHQSPSSSASCQRFEASELKVIQTSGDGRCLFRSLVIGMDSRLQIADRNKHGILNSPVLNVTEKSQADGLRARVIEFMCDNYDEYKNLELQEPETLNADLPTWLRYSSMEDRIAAMADPLSMPGELEITATSKLLNRQIVVLNSDNTVVQRYGTDTLTNALVVQYTSVGQDVGHYNCVLHRRGQETSRMAEAEIPTSEASSVPSPPPEQQPNPQPSTSTSSQGIREIIQGLSPLPKMQGKRTRSRKTESAAVLTSSPYKTALAEKQNAKKISTKQQPGRQRSKGKCGKNKKRRQGAKEQTSEEEEEWPCLICCEPYSRARPREMWVQCQLCQLWAHEECTPGLAQFICPNCESDYSD
ncbi:hypothetical protein BaRGS_00030060 [Batillaria attramentaria]|uniref:OTU domain-containing protein n=1 Tax=Batillaria attramentaria TaxID=370345 RepID=A0ABD0JVP2_9CAEN